jgi:hypothetical protein
MIGYRIVALDSAAAAAARTLPVGPEVERVIANAPHAFPCRHCLTDAAVGEELVLLRHDPFAQPGPFREVGPIFVHQRACTRAETGSALPDQLGRRLLALRGYDARERMVACEVTLGRELAGLVEQLLGRPEVAFLHVRFARAGCFACRIERG